MRNREEIVYNKVVNIAEDGEITVLDGVFKYSDGFKGATGTRFYAVTEDQIQERIGEYEGEDLEFLKHLADSGFEINSNIINSIDTSREALIAHFFDLSYSELWDYLKEETDNNNAVIFDCVGGGRCFDKYFQGNHNVELSEIIRTYES